VHRPAVGALIKLYLIQGSCTGQGWAMCTCIHVWEWYLV